MNDPEIIETGQSVEKTGALLLVPLLPERPGTFRFIPDLRRSLVDDGKNVAVVHGNAKLPEFLHLCELV